jgi:3'-phosphoadenosine 5'-phosphosulfate sulfotransferase (PAPS reductase)/FAD synthetase
MSEFYTSTRRVLYCHRPNTSGSFVCSSAWLVSDNVIVALLHKYYPELLQGMGLAAVDTLHLFPETHIVADAVQRAYGKQAAVFKPLGVETKAEYINKYGDAELISHDKFDYDSKIEPYKRALEALGRDILITGRRADQGAARVSLDVWEPANKTLNPLADWSWDAVLTYVDAEGVPYNPAHRYAFRAETDIPATQRHKTEGLPWTRVDLGKPYWQATPEELAGSPPAHTTYVFKSFGDVHSSVPVLPTESERAGRFVRVQNTECGIHTRAAAPGVPHGGKLVDLMVTDPSERASVLTAAIASGKTIDLNERQVCGTSASLLRSRISVASSHFYSLPADHRPVTSSCSSTAASRLSLDS